MKSCLLTFGLGAVVGAIAILTMPSSNPTRKLAAQAACKVEDAAHQIGCKMTQGIDM